MRPAHDSERLLDQDLALRARHETGDSTAQPPGEPAAAVQDEQ